MNREQSQTTAFWNGFIRALEAEPHEAKFIQGASGIQHPLLAVGLDRSRRRLIVVFDEENFQTGAFRQADIQSAFRAIEVIGALPSPVVSVDSDQDSISSDRASKTGICPIPLDKLSPDEIELISNAADLTEVRAMLRRQHLLQYFFPAADHLALGLFESARVPLLAQLIDQLVRTPDFGHPFGPTELMPSPYSFTEMVKELQNLGLVSETEGDFQITDAGLRVRALVRDKPRESLLFKILNRFSASLYLKSLLHPDLYSRRR